MAGLAFACSEGGDSEDTGSQPLPPVATIEIAPPSASLDSGATLSLVAILRTAQGDVVTRPVNWTSANPAIVSVSSNGLATANAPGGPVAVTAQSEGRSGSALVSVPNTPAVVRTVTLTSSVDTIVVRGRTAQLSATPTDAQGRTIVGRQVRWQVGAPAIATIDASGLLTAIASGRVTITADVDGVRGRLRLGGRYGPRKRAAGCSRRLHAVPRPVANACGASFRTGVARRDPSGRIRWKRRGDAKERRRSCEIDYWF
ncbi:MAG: Ig domain-containing protein [Gemmatimonadetes bacterium]|nr:Ig domain-containing protein [Gemmatimonadota bacterium]